MDRGETQPPSSQEKDQRYGVIILRPAEIDRQINALSDEKEQLLPELRALKEAGANIEGYVEPDPDWLIDRFSTV